MNKYSIETVDNPIDIGGDNCLELKLRIGIDDSRKPIDYIVNDIKENYPGTIVNELEVIGTGTFVGYVLTMPETDLPEELESLLLNNKFEKE